MSGQEAQSDEAHPDLVYNDDNYMRRQQKQREKRAAERRNNMQLQSDKTEEKENLVRQKGQGGGHTAASRQREASPCTEWTDYKCSLMFTFAKQNRLQSIHNDYLYQKYINGSMTT